MRHPDEETLSPSRDPAGLGAVASSQDHRPLVVIADDDLALAEELARQIGPFGYVARAVAWSRGLGDIARQLAPAALIVDLEPECDPLDIANEIAEVQRGRPMPTPIVFVSERTDLDARLHAVRAGGHAYFARPVDVDALVDKLDVLTAHRWLEPYRILVVEDEKDQAGAHAEMLRQAGMWTTVLTHPMGIMQPMVDFDPDLVLMDVHLPDCDGLELAAVIRQQEAYIGIPIVFLAARAAPDRRLDALSFGGDDYLGKPVEPERLVASVASRAQRSRLLRSLMSRDGLTGLLNHSKTKEELATEVARARRQGTRLAFAMLDIDNFKHVNDTYGHATGDRVLRRLSRLLQQRLRKTDIIGRYGGEEFAVILVDTDGPAALQVLDAIRSSFAQVQHACGEARFSVTLSGGVSSFPECDNAAMLNEAADRALYRAKHAGRNLLAMARSGE